MKQEIFSGFNIRKVTSVLREAGFLAEKSGSATVARRLPNFGLVRVYHLASQTLI
jgi:hypothetical protein